MNESIFQLLDTLDLGGQEALWQVRSNGATPLNASNLTTQDAAEGDDTTSGATDIVGIWITGLCCLLGLAGNILSFMVLLRAHGHSPMFFVLRAVAISDAIFLLCVFILSTLVNMYPATHLYIMRWGYLYRGYIQFSIWPVMMMTQMSTVWLTVLVSMERYVAICFPLHSATICTISKVRKAVIVTFVVSITYNIPRYFEHEVIAVEDGDVTVDVLDKTDMAHHVVYRYLYNGLLYALVLFLVPLLMLIYLNFRLVWALQKGKKQWETLQFRQKKEQNLTIIPLCIVLVFFVCGTPALIVNVIDSMNPYAVANPSYVIFMVIANLLVVLNSACNFIIYCLLGKKFRSQLVAMCRCKCTPYRAVHMLAPTQVSEMD